MSVLTGEINVNTLFNNFNNFIMPNIAEGAAITKDYFLDLFGRYVQYEIITSVLSIVLCAIIIIALIVTGKWMIRKHEIAKKESHRYDGGRLLGAIFTMGFGVVPLTIMFQFISFTLKLIFIPEIAVYGLLSPMIK